MNETALIIMAKEPKVGSTKTRLCPPLTLDEAAMLYEALLLDTVDLGLTFNNIDLAIAVTPSDSTPYFNKIAQNALLVPVDCDDIGQCLSIVLEHLLNTGYRKALALNSDGPSLPGEYIQQAVTRLDDHDLVFGPSEDGGYYLVGLKEIHSVFTGIEWSTSLVLRQTLDVCEGLGLNTFLLPPWYDVDTAADIQRLQKELTTLPENMLEHSRTLLESSIGNWLKVEKR